MKKYYFLAFALVITLESTAQVADSTKQFFSKNFKLFSKEMNKRFAEEEKNISGKKVLNEKERDGAKEKWKRLEHYYSTHLDKDGNMINYVQQNDAALKQLQIGNDAFGNWGFVGPFDTEDNFDFTHDEGIGRVNCIAFIDADTWLVGTAGGGLWKTDVAGVYIPNVPPFDKPWVPLTDNNAVLSISGIAVNPSAPNKIYILTGDGDWSINGDGVVPNTPSLGILKTTDGGATWTTTSLVFEKSKIVSAHKLLMNPANASKMYAATSDGLYTTADGWATKDKLLAGENVWDIEFHPANNKIIYISTTKKLYVSTDGLATEPTEITNRLTGLDSDGVRIKIAVSAAAADNLYVIAANGGANSSNRGLDGIWVSTNKGNVFTPVLDGHDLNILAHDGYEDVYADGQAEYDLAFAVDPSNSSKIMVGGIGMWVSYSGGISWVHLCGEDDLPDTYVHADIHTIEFNPFANTIVTGTDGGLWVATAGDNVWEKRCRGLSITQYYHFDVNTASSYFAGEIIGGAQDNGITSNPVAAILSSGETFNPVNFEHQQRGGDGFNTFSGTGDFFEQRYGETQYGKLFLHTKDPVFNSWGYNEITPAEEYTNGKDDPNGSWDTPIEPNPNEFKSIVAGYQDLYFSNDYGSNWNNIWSKPGTGFIKEIAWNKNNGNNIAFYSEDAGLVTTNQLYLGVISGNYNWQEKSLNDITKHNVTISDIQFTDDIYPNNLVITIPGYTDSVKVFRLTKDSTWRNISYNLPNTPALCAAVDEFGIYVGTDIGVFFLADKDSVWTYFSKNLPTVPVTQIEVVQDVIGRRVYASTFGRGIWKSNPAPPKRVTRYYVNKAATGAGDGSSWPNAYTKVQDAIFKAIPGDTIWVAKGTYYPTSTYAMPGGSAARTYTFIIDSNTVIYGGFNGTETNLNQRDIALNVTELTGDIGVPVTANDNSYHVLTILNSTKNSMIDGFRIRDGYANGTNSVYPALYRGSAVLLAYDSLNSGRPFFKNCEFVNNLAAQGGAVFVSQYFKSNAKTSFLKCTFSQNYTFNNAYGERGGAICVDASPASIGPYGTVSITIDSCVFQYNNSPNGGAIYNDADNKGTINYSINQTKFLYNKSSTTTGYGGAIFNYTNSKGILNLTLNSCTFTDNDAPNAGGAIYNSGSGTLNDDDMKVYVKNCRFDSCSGYAIYSTGGKIFLSADKSNFTNNTGGIQHAGATVDGLSTGKITNCTFTNTSTGIYLNGSNSGTGFTNKSINYSIDSCIFTNNSYGLYLNNYSQGQNAKHVQYTLSNSTFTNHTASAVYNYGSDNSYITATLKKNTFTNNKSTSGGAVYSNGYQNGTVGLYIDSCDFIGNKATSNGGALYNYHIDTVSVNHCKFINDTAASGGAVYNFGQYKNSRYKLDFRNCTYTNNMATASGGAILFSNNGSTGMDINVINNTFNGNTAANYGGSLYASTSSTSDTVNLHIDSCTFNNSTTTLNTTQSHGGAVYLYAYNMTAAISHTNITNGKAKARGGAIYAEKTNVGNKLALTITDCNIESNSSDVYGGALVINSLGNTDFTMNNCTLKSNSALLGIGGMYIYSNGPLLNANMNHTIFDGNTTPLSSGALQINADGKISGAASNCTFKNNTATTTGGAVRLYSYANDLNDFDFKNCLFNNNTAGDNGGAAYIQTDLSGKFNNAFDNCVITNNKALRGGGLYISTGYPTANISVPVTNCTIANNNATIETGGVYIYKASTPVVDVDMVNTILWGNTDIGAALNKKQAYISGNATGSVNNSIIQDGIPSGYADSGFNVFTNPLFKNSNDVDGTDDIFATDDDGYSLQTASPAHNTGAFVPIQLDITGLARPQETYYDMGAYEINGCIKPDAPTISGSNILCAGDSATLTASGNLNSATNWQWYITGCGANAVATGNTYKFAPSSTTTVFVRGEGGCVIPGNCNSYTITVNAKSGSVNGLTLTSATTCSLQFSWAAVADASSYEGAYKQSSSGTWISLGDMGNTTTKTITGLTANTAYDFRVRTRNATSCKGDWVQIQNRQTDLYNEPENPSEINITSSSAKLQWLAPTSCSEVPVSYTVNGKATAGGGATTKTVTGTSFKAIGLLPSTQYTWKVSANYASGSSAYTTPRNFTTLATATIAKNNILQNPAAVNETIDKTAALYQNIPNPFTNKTTISYALPQQYKSAQIIIVNHTGIVIEFIQLKGSGKGSVTFNAGTRASSSYEYSLYVDGKLADTKQMILAK